MRLALLLRSFVVTLAACAPAAFALAPAWPDAPPPAPRLVVAELSEPLQLQRVQAQATVTGSQAQTRLELVVRNPNPRVLEATLEFPLSDGQTVTGFALDIHGALVNAVPVPKDKGRQVFDDVTRQRVDPALLERTAGNSFKLRIYPLPAGGTRRVVLQIAETLQPDADGQWRYRLPLDFDLPIGQFDGRFAVRGAAEPQPAGALAGAERFTGAGEAGVQLQRQDWRPREPLAITWRGTPGDAVLVQPHDGTAYAYAELPVDASRAFPRLPRELHVVWDASGSGAQRDHAREFALLDALFIAARNVRVRLTLARDVAEPPQWFAVRGGDWAALRQVLERVPYDGATSAAAWLAGFGPAGPGSARSAMTLLFTDGLANWPDPDGARATDLRAPVYAVTAATRTDAPRLRRLAEAYDGQLVDLGRLDTPAALDVLTRPALRLVDSRAEGAEQVLAASAHPEGGLLRLAARLTAPQATLQLTLADGQGRRVHRTVRLTAPPAAAWAVDGEAGIPLAARRWAELRVQALEADRPRHRAEIRRVGEQFRLLSSETSLIVLDDLADYVRYGIEPPTAALRAEYRRRVLTLDRDRQQARERQAEGLARRFAEREAWWAREFPKDDPRPVTRASAADPAREERLRDVREAALRRVPPPAPAAPPPALAAVAPAPASRAVANVVVPGAPDSAAAQPSTPAPAAIALRPWEPDAAYARRLREASDADRYAVYLDERPAYLNSTAFFIDAADIFFAKGQPALALRVLSNLAEMALENRHILRILAYRLMQADELALAVPLLERVRELAPDEPQSSRDLALALAQFQQPQRAVDLLWDVASRPWDARFADVDLIALTELNAIAARNTSVDLARVDPRLRRNLPLDLRAVLAWDADNTDIDLWVTDPDGEKAFYGHRLTRQGGAMSRDFTAGYGPEEFSLHKAKPGRYEVRAQFYGHRQQLLSPYTTLMLWLSTGFGTPDQKDQRVVLRLSGRGEQVLVGTFEVGGAAR